MAPSKHVTPQKHMNEPPHKPAATRNLCNFARRCQDNMRPSLQRKPCATHPLRWRVGMGTGWCCGRTSSVYVPYHKTPLKTYEKMELLSRHHRITAVSLTRQSIALGHNQRLATSAWPSKLRSEDNSSSDELVLSKAVWHGAYARRSAAGKAQRSGAVLSGNVLRVPPRLRGQLSGLI